MRMLLVLLVLVSGAGMVHAQPPILVGPQGQYLGTLSANPYDPNSVSKPVRSLRLAVQRGLDQQSVQPGGSPYSPNSVTNPYATQGPRVVGPAPGMPPGW